MSANQTAIDESVLRTIKTVESGLSNKIDLIAAQINQKMLMINEKMDSMSSEYNKLLKPAMVMVNEGKSRLIIKREKYEDLIRSEGLK